VQYTGVAGPRTAGPPVWRAAAFILSPSQINVIAVQPRGTRSKNGFLTFDLSVVSPRESFFGPKTGLTTRKKANSN